VVALRRLLLTGRTRFGIWLPLTLLVVLVGLLSSFLLAQSLANSEAKKARDTFRFASDEICGGSRSSRTSASRFSCRHRGWRRSRRTKRRIRSVHLEREAQG
jgi:hypothetical protein